MTTVLCNFSTNACSCKMLFFLNFCVNFNIKVKLEDNQLCADCFSCVSLSFNTFSRVAGCGKYNSVYYCTKIITFSLSRSVAFSPCMRHLRINKTSGGKFHCGGWQKVEIFQLRTAMPSPVTVADIL